jgi:hypothetical protein
VDPYLFHNNVGYVFEWGTLKDNFDKELDTMMDFLALLDIFNIITFQTEPECTQQIIILSVIGLLLKY